VIYGQFAGEMGPQWNLWVINTSAYNPVSYGAIPSTGFTSNRERKPKKKFGAPT
jgi:hypothetical protein